MSIKKRVAVTAGILNAIEETDEIYLKYKPLLHRWAIKAVSMIGHKFIYERATIKRTVNECRISLPENAVHVNGIFLGDLGNECYALTDTKYYQESNLTLFDQPYVYKWSELDCSVGYSVYPWNIRNNGIVFDCDVNNEVVTIDILLHELDSDGIPLMHEKDADVVSEYIKLMLVNKTKFQKFMKNQLRNADFAFSREIEGLVGMAIKNSKTYDEDMSQNHKEAIGQMINHPLTGKGNLNLL